MNVVDMHCDTISMLLKKRRQGEAVELLKNDYHLDLQKMKKSNYLLQNFALFVNMKAGDDAWKMVQDLYEVYQEEMEKNKALIAPVYSYKDIEKNRLAGKLSALLTVEEGGVCGGELERLEKLYEQGVRMLTLAWNYINELGSPNINQEQGKQIREEASKLSSNGKTQVIWSYLNTPNVTEGLTAKGIQFVERMEELGMIIDVSHLSDAGFYDVLKYTRNPFVASHSNARSLCPNARNMNDDMIKQLANRGGVMGLNFCTDFLIQLPAEVYNPGSLEAMVAHVKHMVNIGGIEVVGLGSDFDGIDTNEALPAADQMDKLYHALGKEGFSGNQIENIFSKNVLRLYKDILK